MVNFVQKGSSWRINFADFPEVLQAEYAKMVITEVKGMVSDSRFPSNPEPESFVKVAGGDTFIPLFFNPKPSYWDYQGGATDFDGQTFPNAFMSFRVDDEVIVQLKEGAPFAVVKFADCVPRIGESVIKATGPQLKGGKQYVTVWPIGSYSGEDTGPDGLDLKLVTESKKRVVKDTTLHSTYSPTWEDDPVQYYTSCNFTVTGGPILCGFIQDNYYLMVAWTHHQDSYTYIYTVDHVFCVGPALFFARIKAKTTWGEIHSYFVEQGPFREYNVVGAIQGCPAVYALQVLNQAKCDNAYPLPGGPAYTESVLAPKYYAAGAWAQYTKANYETAMNMPDSFWPEYDDEHPSQNGPITYPPGFKEAYVIPGSLMKFIPEDERDDVRKPEFKIFVRPHTKQELIDADMWPDFLPED